MLGSNAVCTIIILNQVAAHLPLVIAANRDELYGRAATGPQVIQPGSDTTPRAIGGIDEPLGGTWMGATEDGFFVGLTNQRTFRPANRELRSRGQVVMDGLRRGSITATRHYLEELDGREYNPFNLIYGDGRGLEVARANAGTAALSFEPVPPGVHVLPNDRLNSDGFPKVKRARALLGDPGSLRSLPWTALEQRLTTVLQDHHMPTGEPTGTPPPDSWLSPSFLARLQALCIHTEHYGTCSATILAIAPGRVAHYLFASGAPCVAPFDDVTSLLTG